MPNSTKTPSLTLQTENYYLRPLTVDDATETYLSWMNDPEVCRYLNSRLKTQTIETIREYILRHNNQDSFLFGIFAGDNGHIGNIALKANKLKTAIHMGVMIGDKNYWGQNVIIEARSRVLDFCFEELEFETVEGGCYKGNRPALYNFIRQGYKKVQVVKSGSQNISPEYDLVHFRLTRAEWISRKNEKRNR